MKKIKLFLTMDEYFDIKRLFNACSTDFTMRIALTRVFYHSKRKELIATNGHLLRLYKPSFHRKYDFFLQKKDFLLTEYQFRHIYADGLPRKKIIKEKFIINLDIITDEKQLPGYDKVLEFHNSGQPTKSVWMNIGLIFRFGRTFKLKPSSIFRFEYTGNTAAIKIFMSDYEVENVFVGLIMPKIKM